MDLFLKEAEYWDSPETLIQNPWQYERIVSIFFDSIKKEFISIVKKRNPKRVLEIGCGDGWLADELSIRGEYIGVDISRKRIEKAKNRGLKAQFINANILELEFDEGYFDLVIAWDSLHHIPDINGLYKKIHKWLSKKGMFLVNDYIGIGRFREYFMGLMLILFSYERVRILKGLSRRKEMRSPFEEVSGIEIIRVFKDFFTPLFIKTYNPLFFKLQGRIKAPLSFYRFIKHLDDMLNNWVNGGYTFLSGLKND